MNSRNSIFEAALICLFFWSAATANADTITPAGAVFGSSNLPGQYFALYGTTPVGTITDSCPRSQSASLLHLPAGISASVPLVQICSGFGYSTIVPHGQGGVQAGLFGLVNVPDLVDMIDLQIGAKAPTSFTVGLVTNVDNKLYDYPNAFAITSSAGGNSGVIATRQLPSGAVDTYLFKIEGAAPGETVHIFVQQTTPNVPYGPIPSLVGITIDTVQQAIPVNFRQAYQTSVNGTLITQYNWDSSSGNLADLQGCRVGESVEYPTEDEAYIWPAPWNTSTTNPYVAWQSATQGEFKFGNPPPDGDHQRPGAFKQPYPANGSQGPSFIASQSFRYSCPKTGLVSFSNWTNIPITRTISDSTGRGCWGYAVTKSGGTASIPRLPGVKKKSC